MNLRGVSKIRKCNEIYDLFLDLINKKVDEVRISLAEINMLSKLRPEYTIFLHDIYIAGSKYTPADIFKKICIENNIIQYEDLKNNCYVYKRGDE